jgi:endonuclease-3
VETVVERKKRASQIVRVLRKTYPDARLALDFETALDLLISLILAAQCTDERVNRVTADLFRKYRQAKDWAGLDRTLLEEEIRSTGFYRNKAKSIQGCTQALVERFNGEVPGELDDLLSLPGVGRKTANIVIGNAFGRPAIGVDTHVGRLARRLGLSREKDPDKVEASLVAVVSRQSQVAFCHLIQLHGRAICVSRKPKCDDCVIEKDCPRVGVD